MFLDGVGDQARDDDTDSPEFKNLKGHNGIEIVEDEFEQDSHCQHGGKLSSPVEDGKPADDLSDDQVR